MIEDQDKELVASGEIERMWETERDRERWKGIKKIYRERLMYSNVQWFVHLNIEMRTRKKTHTTRAPIAFWCRGHRHWHYACLARVKLFLLRTQQQQQQFNSLILADLVSRFCLTHLKISINFRHKNPRSFHMWVCFVCVRICIFYILSWMESS